MGRWGKIVPDVIHDAELSSGAKVMFCELALWAGRGDGTVSRGQRALAAAIHITQETARGYLEELEAAGHVDIARNGKRRHWYVLKSPVYWEKSPARKKRAA